jgi:predicted ribonuclease YlaK
MATKNVGRIKKREFDDIEKAMADNYKSFDFRFKKRDFKFTEKQKQLIDIILDPDVNVVLIEGPAGTSKSLTSVYAGLTLLKDKRTESVMYVRSVVESATKSMGYLPGTEAEKLHPFKVILDQKVQELVEDADLSKLNKSGLLNSMPLNHVRGCSWKNMFIICDETQQMEHKEILTVMSRIGIGSKMILAGDRMQTDVRKSGFADVFELFSDEESNSKGIVTFKFDESDIVRSEILKFIVSKFKDLKM